MRDNVVDLNGRVSSEATSDDSTDFDKFLLAEGLELLANLRAIDDPAVRASVAALLRALAKKGS